MREAEAQELHGGDLGEHVGELVLDDLERGYGLAELHPLFGVGQGRLVGGDGVPYGLPRDHRPRRREDLVRVLEGVGPGELVLQGDADVFELHVRLPDGALAHLAGDELGGEAGGALLDEVAADVALLVAGPDYGYVGEGGVADPTLLPV